jgi:hypothetical protein
LSDSSNRAAAQLGKGNLMNAPEHLADEMSKGNIG